MNPCRVGFNGQRLDPISGASHLGNGYRAYHPSLMRFNRPDGWAPFGAGGINPYLYCDGDPLNRVDPSGHASWLAGLGIGLGILGIVAALLTGGAAIAVAGSLSAAIGSASPLSLLSGIAGLVADVSGIASTATAHSNRRASAALSWISLAAGMLSLGMGLASMAWRRVNSAVRQLGNLSSARSTWGNVDDIENIQMLGVGSSTRPSRITDIYYSFDDVKKGSRRLNIVAHGRFEQSLNYATVGFSQVSTRYTGASFAAYLSDMGINFSDYADGGVRLIVCYSADGADSFAASFARQSGLSVKAFSGPVTTEGELQSMVNAHASPTHLEKMFNGNLLVAEESLNEGLVELESRDNLFRVIKENRGISGGYNPLTTRPAKS